MQNHPWEPRWKTIRKLGGGVQAVTYIVDDPDGKRCVAKSLRKPSDEGARRRMFREVSALKLLNTATGIAAHADSNVEAEWQGTADLYLVMEYIEGKSLLEFVSQNHPVDAAVAIQIAIRLVEILRYCHTLDPDEPIVHRDIKPVHVILRDDVIEDPYLIDFGLSFNGPPDSESEFDTEIHETVGTKFLRLPEMMTGNKRDPRSDVTLCVGILFFALSNVYPQSLEYRGRKPHQRIDPTAWGARLTEWQRRRVAHIFDRGFERDSDRRWQSCDSLLMELREFAVGPGAESERSFDDRLRAFMDECLQSQELIRLQAFESVKKQFETSWRSVLNTTNQNKADGVQVQQTHTQQTPNSRSIEPYFRFSHKFKTHCIVLSAKISLVAASVQFEANATSRPNHSGPFMSQEPPKIPIADISFDLFDSELSEKVRKAFESAALESIRHCMTG